MCVCVLVGFMHLSLFTLGNSNLLRIKKGVCNTHSISYIQIKTMLAANPCIIFI